MTKTMKKQPTKAEITTALERYIASGLTNFVFLLPGSKAAFYEFYHDLRGGLQDVRHYLQKYIDRRPGVGLVMGRGQHEYIALDFDDFALYERWKAANPELAQTATNRTPSGFHVLFRVTEGTPVSGVGPNVSIISAGWHIAVWPSYHPTGQRYEWLIPPWDRLVEVKRFDEDLLGLAKVGIEESNIQWEVDEYGQPQGEWYCEECMQVDYCACGVNAWRWREL